MRLKNLAAAFLIALCSPFLTAAGRAPAAAPPPPRPIAVTIDDLPVAATGLHPDAADRKALTARLLAVLRKHNIPATGFVVGSKILGPADEENLRAWLRHGHELGNHTWSHLDLGAVAPDTFVADAERCRAKLDTLLQTEGRPGVRWFRFPFLCEGDSPERLTVLRDYLARTGQRNAHVTIDDQDWSYEEPWVAARRAGDAKAMAAIGAAYQRALQMEVAQYEDLGDRLFQRITPQILLLHANEVGAAQWDSLFSWLTETNHRFVPLETVLADSAFDAPPAFLAPYGSSLWERIRADRRESSAKEAVAALLKVQCDAWNRGDVDTFCAIYDDSALFVAPTGLTRGREAVRARYLKRYPDRAAMGQLELDIVEMRALLGREISMLDDAVPGRVQGLSVAARWTLTFAPESGAAAKPPATGYTLMLLKPTPRGWVIVQDASM